MLPPLRQVGKPIGKAPFGATKTESGPSVDPSLKRWNCEFGIEQDIYPLILSYRPSAIESLAFFRLFTKKPGGLWFIRDLRLNR